jgi:hypothetical protein
VDKPPMPTVEPAEVDHDGAAAGGAAVVRVAAGAADQRDVEPLGPADHRAHVRDVTDLHDSRRLHAVVTAVEDDPRAVVGLRAGSEHAAAHRVAERAHLPARQAVERQR